MSLPDIEITDDPYTTLMLTRNDLQKAESLAGLGDTLLDDLARIGEGVAETILNNPQDVNGHRYIARATYRETVRFDRNVQHWRLGRAPATLTQLTLNGDPVSLDEVSVHAASGVVSCLGWFFAWGDRAVFEYDAGWRTPAQADDGAPENFGPAIPAGIIQAAVRAAQLAHSGLSREDVGARSVREVDDDAGAIETTYAAPPTQAGEDAEIFRLLAPWRRLVLS